MDSANYEGVGDRRGARPQSVGLFNGRRNRGEKSNDKAALFGSPQAYAGHVFIGLPHSSGAVSGSRTPRRTRSRENQLASVRDKFHPGPSVDRPVIIGLRRSDADYIAVGRRQVPIYLDFVSAFILGDYRNDLRDDSRVVAQ